MKTALLVCCAILGGCASSTTSQVEQINEIRARADAQCQSHGYKPGTQNYQTCYQIEAQKPTAGMVGQSMATQAAGIGVLTAVSAIVSDARLKTDVSQVGMLQDGIGLYRFRYLGTEPVFVGVMAQEVERVHPEAVVRGSDGYLRVNYALLGSRMMTWEEWQHH